MSVPQLVVHEKKDTIGLVVVEGLEAGTRHAVRGEADNYTFWLNAKINVPIGHEVALTEIESGDTVCGNTVATSARRPIQASGNTRFPRRVRSHSFPRQTGNGE